jgi:hypothetical protein
VEVVGHNTINIKQLSLGISGNPNIAQSHASVLFATFILPTVLGLVAVKPKFPATVVEAERITEFIPRINFPCCAVGIKGVSGIIRPALNVPPTACTFKFPVEPSS